MLGLAAHLEKIAHELSAVDGTGVVAINLEMCQTNVRGVCVCVCVCVCPSRCVKQKLEVCVSVL